MPNVVQGGREIQPGGILEYFEDLNRASNAEFGPISLRSTSFARHEDFFEIASIQIAPLIKV